MNTIIEKIRAEVERQEKQCPLDTYDGRHKLFILGGLKTFLSDLEKEEKPINPVIEKLRALIKMQIRREELNFASLGGGGQTMNIGALEWVLKQLDTLQEQPVCEGLEDEAVSYCFDNGLNLSPMVATDFARHFAQWQKEQMMKEAVEWDYPLEDGRIEFEGDPLPCLNPILNLPYPKFKPGQKVKLIIVKED